MEQVQEARPHETEAILEVALQDRIEMWALLRHFFHPIRDHVSEVLFVRPFSGADVQEPCLPNRQQHVEDITEVVDDVCSGTHPFDEFQVVAVLHFFSPYLKMLDQALRLFQGAPGFSSRCRLADERLVCIFKASSDRLSCSHAGGEVRSVFFGRFP